MHRPSGRWPGSVRLWSVWSSRVINLQELIIQTRPVSVHPGNWGRGSWQGPWFWVCTAAPERLQEPNCWRQVHKTEGKKRTSLSCFLQFPYKVSQNQLTIQLILIASRVPAPSPCFLLFFCFFYVCVSHVNRIRSVEYFNYGNNKKTHCCFFFSLFLEEVLPPALLLVGITSLPLNTASATLEHGLRHSKRRREVKPRRRIATSSLMMGAPLTLHYPRWFHSLTFLMNRLPTQLVPAPNATFFFFCSAPCPII